MLADVIEGAHDEKAVDRFAAELYCRGRRIDVILPAHICDIGNRRVCGRGLPIASGHRRNRQQDGERAAGERKLVARERNDASPLRPVAEREQAAGGRVAEPPKSTNLALQAEGF